MPSEHSMTYQHLASPFTAGTLNLSNRIVMPPMVQWSAPRDDSVTSSSYSQYEDAKGPGLVIVEATTVAPEGRLYAHQLGIFEDRHVEGLRTLAEVIHANGAQAAIQIHHAGRNTRTKGSFFGHPLVAPSSLNEEGAEVPQELTPEGIERIIACFGAAARRAMEAGFDAVELHAAHGFLFSQFLSPLSNRRTNQITASAELPAFKSTYADAAFMAKLYKTNPMSQVAGGWWKWRKTRQFPPKHGAEYMNGQGKLAIQGVFGGATVDKTLQDMQALIDSLKE